MKERIFDCDAIDWQGLANLLDEIRGKEVTAETKITLVDLVIIKNHCSECPDCEQKLEELYSLKRGGLARLKGLALKSRCECE